MTRTVKFGTPSEEAQTIYNIVLEAETNAIEQLEQASLYKILIKSLETL